MTRLIIIFILSLTFHNSKSQYTPIDIFGKSKTYYSKIENGTYQIVYTFKSSIAESYNISNLEISFCKKKRIMKSISDDIGIMLSGNKYYLTDNKKKIYVDLSSYKDFKNEKRQSFGQYPFINSAYFDGLINIDYKVETIGNTFHVYNFSDHFYFDTLDYSIVKYRNVIIDATGIQIKEWAVASYQIHKSCSDKKKIYSYLREFEKVKSFGSQPKNPEYTGFDFSSLVSDSIFQTSDGSLVFIESLKGKYILLDFFYQSCMPCILSFKHLKDLNSLTFENEQLYILGIDPVLSDSLSMEKFKKRYQLTYSIITGNIASRINSIFNPAGIFPYYILIDPNGKIIRIHGGFDETFFKDIAEFLTK